MTQTLNTSTRHTGRELTSSHKILIEQLAQQDQTQQTLLNHAGQLAGTPLMDPSKNPQMMPEEEPPVE